jgi:hypothetical protein
LLFLIIKIITSFLGEFVLSIAPKTMQKIFFFLHQKQRESKKSEVSVWILYQDQGEPVKDVHAQSSV